MKTIEDVSESFHFTGVCHLLLVGQGRVQLLKSVDGGKNYYPMTDASGDVIELENDIPGGVVFNAELDNDCHRVHYKVKVLDGEVSMEYAK